MTDRRRSERMPEFKVSSLVRCFNGCSNHAPVSSGLSTRIWNHSDKPLELQIRVGSILKRAHTLKPGSSKRLNSKTIYRDHMPRSSGNNYYNGGGGGGNGTKRLLYYYDETCHRPYIWVHDARCDFSRMVKQQYVSLEDLRDSSEIRIFTDHLRGCISVTKKPRPDFC